ncbi:MAG: DinB family protein [Planctomycetota bacterium]
MIFEHDYPYTESLSSRLQIALRKIEFSRKYMLTLLDDLTEDDWFWVPDAFPTHVAWQVGHLCMSQYGLTLFQQRGRNREVDSQLMSSKFRKLFMRGTTPVVDRETHPSRQEILDVLNKVHTQMRTEVIHFSDEELHEPLDPPHAAYATRYGALLFCSDHEMLHAGQIGFLRRLMGKPPLR